MQTVILAGGRGARLRPFTDIKAKPMIPIHDKPFLQHQLGLIKFFGLTEILFLVGYLGRQIETYFGNGLKLGLDIKYSYEENALGTGGAIKHAENMLAEEFLLLNGDTYLSIDYGELIAYFHQSKKIGVIVVYNNPNKIMANNISVNQSNIIINYNKKCSSGMTHVDSGVMLFKKELLAFIPSGRPCSLEEEVFHKLIKIRELLAFPTKERFYDIGSPEGLYLMTEILKS